MAPAYAAHTPPAGSEHWQPLLAHAECVATRARRFLDPVGLGELGWATGLLHDAGKCSDAFQAYLRACHQARKNNTPPPPPGVDHKSAGALLAVELFPLLAPVLLGHHGGLPARAEAKLRLQDAAADAGICQALAAARRELPLAGLPAAPALLKAAEPLAPDELACDVMLRFLFSALVDADWLDTERHFSPSDAALRGATADLPTLWQALEADQDRLLQSAAETPVNAVRRAVYEDCLRAATLAPGVFRLTVPTGGGKTRSSLAFALRHALAHRLERVIYAIPYTSIIEQTAGVFEGIFGPGVVLEHHSAVQDGEEEDVELSLRRRLASENWDAPLIVTTTVQLFESLFAARPGRCRKVHRVARSVLILDEVQTLPERLLAPILDMLRALVTHYGVTVVLCTATQPTLEGESGYLRGLPHAREIVREPARHFAALRRVEYRVAPEAWTWEQAAAALRESPQGLAILNRKRDALALLEALDDPDALHLSTLLCGAHRRRVLAEVRERLRANRPCRLVATQVVEAGVDLDFPRVLRAVGPLDRIVQAAGRCNREGRRSSGEVVVFTPADGGAPRGAYATALGHAERILRQPGVDLHDPAIFATYFARLFQDVSLDEPGIQRDRAELRFPSVAENFRLIQEDTVPVLVPYDPEAVAELVARVRALGYVPLPAWRQAQQHSVSLYRHQFQREAARGAIEEVAPGLFRWLGQYHPVRGLGDAAADPADLIA